MRPVATVSWHFPGRQLGFVPSCPLSLSNSLRRDEAWRRLSQILKNIIASNVDASVKLYLLFPVSRNKSSDSPSIFYLEI